MNIIKDYYGNLLDGKVPENRWKKLEKEMQDWIDTNPWVNLGITDEDVEDAISTMNPNKGCGEDFLYPSSLRVESVKTATIQAVKRTLNHPVTIIPSFWKQTRLVLLSKTETEFAEVSNTRPIAV